MWPYCKIPNFLEDTISIPSWPLTFTTERPACEESVALKDLSNILNRCRVSWKMPTRKVFLVCGTGYTEKAGQQTLMDVPVSQSQEWHALALRILLFPVFSSIPLPRKWNIASSSLTRANEKHMEGGFHNEHNENIIVLLLTTYYLLYTTLNPLVKS